ncbi:hypothetical protein C8R45DRAFT_523751 [Mycena sanguinolenta]|nr:hypothetical protein C8R45DRAFT_523751 [Mycena sanguinolenta]
MDDDQPNPNAEFSHSTTREPESPSHASGMFSGSRQFTVMGGTFTNVTNKYAAPGLPSDFRMIPMGDIDLRRQIQVDEHRGIVNYQPHRQACVRRVHSAKARIDGRKSRVTVAMYQGDGAEEEWRQDIAKHMSLRHPNIIQICGAASSNGIHATIFNDDLIPLREILDRSRDSPFSTVYISACCTQDFTEAFNYIYRAFQPLFQPSGYTHWIRHSTGRLCTELTLTHDGLPIYLNSSEMPGPSRLHSVSTLSTEAITTFIDSLTLEQYHRICAMNLRQYQHFDLSASTTVNLGAVFHCPSDPLEDSVEIAFLPSAEASQLGNWTDFGGGAGEVLPNGWTRFQSGNVFNNTLSVFCGISPHTDWHTWLSQANHIFRRLRIMANFEDYVFLYHIEFQLKIFRTTEDSPPGFLFLCPSEDFQTGPSSLCWPACPAYWSLDPSGVDRLSPEDATHLGFPPFVLTTRADGSYWDASVYEGLRQFHQAKGFDPYSQDVARHLDKPLYQVSSQVEAPFAYVNSEDEHFDADIDSDCDPAYAEDYESESEYPPTSPCDDSDLDVDAGSSHIQEIVQDPVSGDGVSENTEKTNCEGHDAGSIEEDMVVEEVFAPSRSLNILMSIQLGLMFFLGLSWVYDHVAVSIQI